MSFVHRTGVSDAASCERWLAKAPLADPDNACRSLTALLEELEESSPADPVWLDIGDRLDSAIWGAIAAQTKRFSERAVPLTGTAAEAFIRVRALLPAYGRGYKRLLCVAIDDPDSPIAKEAPRIAFRAMQCCRELALAHYRARREPTPEVWEELNEVYRLAEQEGLAAEPARLASLPQSCEQLYIETALVHLVQPYGRSARDLDLLLALAREWSSLARIRLFQADHGVVSVDLKADEPPAFRRMGRAFVRPDTRVIDLRDVKQVLQSHIRANEDEARRAPLAFAEGQATTDVLPLLNHLYKAWFAFPQPRRFKRRIVTDRVEVVVGMSAIHMALGGEAVGGHDEQPRAFGRNAPADEDDPTIQEDQVDRGPPERWDLLDESPVGFRVRRREAGVAVFHRQLVAIRPPGGKAFVLAETRWLMMGIDGAVTLGLQALAGGTPQPVSVRAATGGGARNSEGWSPALASTAPDSGALSLVAVRGTLFTGAMVDLDVAGITTRFRLTSLVAEGYDFDAFAGAANH